MDISTLKKQLESVRVEEYIPAAWLAGGIVFVILFFTMFNRPRYAQLHAVKNEVAAETARLAQYQHIKAFKGKLDEQKDRINATLTTPDLDFSGARDTLDEISMICASCGIKLDKTTGSTIDQIPMWQISFPANYKQLQSLLFAIEKEYRVRSLTIDATKSKALKVDMVVASLLTNTADGVAINSVVNSAGMIDDIYSKIETILTKINDTSSGRAVNELTRDPFALVIPKIEKSYEQPEEPKIKLPSVQIDSIMWDPETPVVIIEGSVLKEGESLNNITVVKIHKNSVVLSWKKHQFVAKLKE